jgi:D-alanyl-D-alanine dipeptidase
MIALKELIPALIVNLPYATTHNFTHTVLYKHPVAYLRLKPALALRQIDSALRKQGFALMLYDAFRPYKVTCLMWQLTPNKRYVADPARGSGHNRGIAVDLNIVNLKTGKELNMGTPFDSFSSKSHHSCTTFSDEILTNRQLLKTTMERYGFRAMDAEWWHYFWVNDEGYEIIDMDFDSLK